MDDPDLHGFVGAATSMNDADIRDFFHPARSALLLTLLDQ